ncbi:DNA-binding protein YbiB [Aquabacterium sp. OR-4]|uniref:DNA-binding protein YbiB n=1 Tax=Aquabacterium sp. OR-4 TaxID=2978127 RepID=UPI0021B46968|nr:DNA-binding protein YbiB [Aquabacterium sp. OR-4]MDT7836142.1 DNA-binding protein YbiB [Aquabacterium sp. OR-4]
MSIAQYIKEIGRGPEGSRPLDAAQASDLFGQVLDGRVSDLELGAFALAMRMKGETVDELVGFCQALDARALPIPALAPERPVVVIPSINGARKLPNLVPLLAMRLAQEGAAVLVHGPRADPARVTSCEVFQALGLPPCDSVAAVHERWARHEPAYMATDVLHPALQRLLDVRRVVGVRNSGHTVAKLLQPVHGAPVLRVTSYTHPEFGALMSALAERTAADIMVLRGTEGEAVADPRRCPKMDTWLGGRPMPEYSCPAQEGVLAELPILPRSNEAAATATYVQSVVAGAQPAPAPLEQQVALLMAALNRLSAPQARRA